MKRSLLWAFTQLGLAGYPAKPLVRLGERVGGDDARRLSFPGGGLGGGYAGHADKHDRHQRTDHDPTNDVGAVAEHFYFPFWKLSQSRKLPHSEQLKALAQRWIIYYGTNKQ